MTEVELAKEDRGSSDRVAAPSGDADAASGRDEQTAESEFFHALSNLHALSLGHLGLALRRPGLEAELRLRITKAMDALRRANDMVMSGRTRASEPEPELSTTAPAVEGDGAAPLTSGAVLLVEDNEAMRTLLTTCLADFCNGVRAVGDGRSGREEFADGSFAFAVIDLQLPDMDGGHLAQWILDQPGMDHFPILIITGLAGGDMAESFPHRPNVRLLPKPFGPGRLCSAVRELLHAAPAS